MALILNVKKKQILEWVKQGQLENEINAFIYKDKYHKAIFQAVFLGDIASLQKLAQESPEEFKNAITQDNQGTLIDKALFGKNVKSLEKSLALMAKYAPKEFSKVFGFALMQTDAYGNNPIHLAYNDFLATHDTGLLKFMAQYAPDDFRNSLKGKVDDKKLASFLRAMTSDTAVLLLATAKGRTKS